MSDTNFSTGAVRSADAKNFSFTSLPMIGLLALARTAGEGADKYGRLNYLQGMPLHDLMEHSFKHLVMYNAGDRSEPHLAHAAWGLLVAIQEEVLRPEAHAEHMLGPGCSITPEVAAHMEKMKPVLAKRRAEADTDAFTWNVLDLSDVRKLRDQRIAAVADAVARDSYGTGSANEKESWTQAVNKAIGDAVRDREKAIGDAVRNREFAPGSTNEKVYGTPTRTETDHGSPSPGPGETWTEFSDGTRAYFPKKSSGNPAVDTFVRDNLAKPCPPKPCPLKACPRPDSYVVPVAPAPCAHENIDLLEEKCRDCGLTKKQIMLSRTPLKSFCDCGMPLHNGRCNRCGRTAATGNTDYLPRS